MKIGISGQPVFWFALTDEQMAVLDHLSALHYDGVCRGATKVGGFIYGWKNARAGSEEESRKRTILKASFREIDTCLKILEGLMHPPGNMPEAQQIEGRKLAKSFHAALTCANETSPSWSTEIEA